MNRSWVVFNGFRTADGQWLRVEVRARDAETAKALAVPVFRYMATKFQPPDILLTMPKFIDTTLFDAFCVEQETAAGSAIN